MVMSFSIEQMKEKGMVVVAMMYDGSCVVVKLDVLICHVVYVEY